MSDPHEATRGLRIRVLDDEDRLRDSWVETIKKASGETDVEGNH
jgi:hypothetical protein